MGVFVKICGLANREDALAVASLKPDALGFVFWPGSPRAVAVEEVARWTPLLPRGIRAVGLFVDPAPAEVARAVRLAGLDTVQLHRVASVEPFRIAGCEVWESVHADRLDWRRIGRGHVDVYQADTYSTTSPGGTGLVGDWDAARVLVTRQPTPVLLAGGLTRDNVRDAIRRVRPWGVDVSSGVEAAPGRKDLRHVEDFIRTCRTAS